MIQEVQISKLKENENNPRLIRDDQLERLVKSLKEFPQMMDARPIVVDTKMIVLGGNMRLKAAKEAGIKKVKVFVAKGWSEKKKREFVIKDNVNFGDWNWEELSEDWNTEELNEWGLDTWYSSDVDLDDFFEESPEGDEPQKNKIILEYTDEEFEKVSDALSEIANTPEQAIWKLLKFD